LEASRYGAGHGVYSGECVAVRYNLLADAIYMCVVGLHSYDVKDRIALALGFDDRADIACESGLIERTLLRDFPPDGFDKFVLGHPRQTEVVELHVIETERDGGSCMAVGLAVQRRMEVVCHPDNWFTIARERDRVAPAAVLVQAG